MRGKRPAPPADVCIIGGGPAGGVLASTLASRGYDVVLLEAGEWFDPADRIQQMELFLRGNDSTDVWNMGGKRDDYTVSGERYYQLNRARVKGIGGSTLHWVGITPRLHEKDFEMQSRYGVGTDWPIGYGDLEPYYSQAEVEMGVAGGEDNPFAPPRSGPFPNPAFRPSYSDSIFAEACDKLDITMHSVPQARNSRSYDGRSPCVGYGTCWPVCPSGAKYSGDVHVEKAQEAGARIIDRVPVQRLIHTSDGETVTAAEYVTPNGQVFRQEADYFVIACGGVETPRLLLLSASTQHPNGLANSSDLVGRYFMEHPTGTTTGVVRRETKQNHIGFQTSESHQFYDHEEVLPGSFKLLFFNTAGPAPQTSFGGDVGVQDYLDVVNGDQWGDELLETLQESYGNRIGLGAAVEQLPHHESRITLDRTRKDSLGNPVPNVRWRIGQHATQTLDHALSIHDDIMTELDATVIHQTDVNSPGNVGHHLGTTRMGNDPQESVVDKNLLAHDLRNLYISSSSVFVTGGAMNPTLTIVALTLRLADRLTDVLG